MASISPFAVGWIALAIAIPGILLSYFYVAPPLKLDYRGLGLGELSIFFSFGPIPALGAFYVLTGGLSCSRGPRLDPVRDAHGERAAHPRHDILRLLQGGGEALPHGRARAG